ncbi:MAG: sulfite exporter TauE/SafE family protein [Actinomycetales bacterium]|nr:sulfite exporter TauE/SafE family protein [Actinomycetales bacterium]
MHALRTAPVPTLALDLGIGLLVGIFSGLLGVGGGLILVPLLVLARHVPQKRAQATSLVMVALAATSGATTYALDHSVAWGPAAWIIIGGVGGTLAGTALLRRTPDQHLQLLFSALLIVAAVRMLLDSHGADQADLPLMTMPVIAGYLMSGLAMGLLSSMFGVGGGIILIPVLVTFFGFSQHLAAGTSLLVMIPIALLGAARLTRAGHTDWPQGLRIGAGALVGAIGGASAALVINGRALQVAFALVMAFAAVQMIQRARTGPEPRP